MITLPSYYTPLLTGEYSLDDLNSQVTLNDGYMVGHPSGVAALDQYAPWIFWYDKDPITVGLGDDYIKSYFWPRNADDVSREVKLPPNPYTEWVRQDSIPVASGSYTLDNLNQLLDTLWQYRDEEYYAIRNIGRDTRDLVEELEWYSEWIEDGNYSLKQLNNYIYGRKYLTMLVSL
jgi:hypothetical protein